MGATVTVSELWRWVVSVLIFGLESLVYLSGWLGSIDIFVLLRGRVPSLTASLSSTRSRAVVKRVYSRLPFGHIRSGFPSTHHFTRVRTNRHLSGGCKSMRHGEKLVY